MSSSPLTQTSRRSRTASATGIGALSPTRSQGAANARGRPAITAISSTGSSAASRYTAPECACTSSSIEASASDRSGRPTRVRAAAGAWADVCPSDTPTTSSAGPRDGSQGFKSPSSRPDAHGERHRVPPGRRPMPPQPMRDPGVRAPRVRPRAP